jgi:fucose permease
MRKLLPKGLERTRLACYSSYFTMSSVFCLPALLFTTFHRLYGISYTLLGTLVLTNFCTQLTIDLIFTFFSRHFDVKKVIRVMPLITALGLTVYALAPFLFPGQVFVGLALGTVIFSVSAGLSEVLLSPVIAAIPSDDPGREMSLLHSLYAFGFFTVVVASTLLLRLLGEENWWLLTLLLATLPILSSALFCLSPVPKMETESGQKVKRSHGEALMALFVACIFFGSCAENVMGNWLPTYLESVLGIDKTLGDIMGMAMFAILLGLTRMLCGKFAHNIWRVLLVGMVGAAVCYLTAGLAGGTVLPFLACILTGIFAAMLWPGSLILMEEKLPQVGVAAYALMAAGGDLGASLAPQLQGIVVDSVAQAPQAADLSTRLGLSPEQLGMKAGMLVSAVFPVLGVLVLFVILRQTKRHSK